MLADFRCGNRNSGADWMGKPAVNISVVGDDGDQRAATEIYGDVIIGAALVYLVGPVGIPATTAGCARIVRLR